MYLCNWYANELVNVPFVTHILCMWVKLEKLYFDIIFTTSRFTELFFLNYLQKFTVLVIV